MRHRQRKADPHRGVNGVAATAENGNPDIGRMRLDRYDHRLSRSDRFPRGETLLRSAEREHSQRYKQTSDFHERQYSYSADIANGSFFAHFCV